ncbi:MAG: hypothetical protein ACON47_05365 [Flavobacteriaceae bacterium]
MKMNKGTLVWLLLGGALLGTAQSQERILFVGNSFTFYYNIPTTVQQMAKAKGLEWDVYQSTAGGASLKDHWLGNKALHTVNTLEEQSFSKIIFQDLSSNPLVAIDSTAKYLRLLQSKIQNRPEQYLYASWAYSGIAGQPLDGPLNSIPIEDALQSKAVSGEQVVAVGRAFDLFRVRYPQIELLSDDAKHTNPNGSYLAACVFFAKLSGQSAKGLPRREEGRDRNGKKIFYFIVQADVAKKCQAVADAIVFSKGQKE